MRSSPWIFGSAGREASSVWLPAILGAILSRWVGRGSYAEWILLFCVLGFVDSGHVYSTFLRTHLKPSAFQAGVPRWLLPGIFGVTLLWILLRVPGLWTFAIYMTAFHHLRQFYGFSRLYQRNAKAWTPSLDFFLYALCLLPVIAFHFRVDAFDYYSGRELFLFPSPSAFSWLVRLDLGLLGAWVLTELVRLRRGQWSTATFSGVAWPAALYHYCFYFTDSVPALVIPMVLAHGVPYYGVLAQKIFRVQAGRFRSLAWATLVVVLLGAGMGLFERALEAYIVETDDSYLALGRDFLGLGLSLATAIYLTPLFFHYASDALLWRRVHPDQAGEDPGRARS